MEEPISSSNTGTTQTPVSSMSLAPARLYGLKAGVLGIGECADVVVFNPNEKWIVPDKFASKSSNSPFIGWELFGKVKYTICSGKIVYSDEDSKDSEEKINSE